MGAAGLRPLTPAMPAGVGVGRWPLTLAIPRGYMLLTVPAMQGVGRGSLVLAMWGGGRRRLPSGWGAPSAGCLKCELGLRCS